MKNKLLIIFRLLIAVLFIFSALTKIISLSFFDALVAELFFGKNWYQHEGIVATQFLSRILISAELLLGVAVLQQKYLKKVILPALTLTLVLFTVHLVYMGFERGFIGGNCGCFGDVVPMDNFESILKNLATLAMVFYVWKYTGPEAEDLRMRSWIIPVLVGVVTMLTLSLTVKYKKAPAKKEKPQTEETAAKTPDTAEEDTIDKKDTSQVKDEEKSEESEGEKDDSDAPQQQSSSTADDKQEDNASVDQSAEEQLQPGQQQVTETSVDPEWLTEYNTFSSGEVDLTRGKKLICLFSLSCGHCQAAYEELCEIREALPDIYLIVYGSDFDKNHFFEYAGCEDPYIQFEDYSNFVPLLEGDDFPKVIAVEEGAQQKAWDYDSYDIEEVKKHYNIKEKKKKENGLDIETEEKSGNWY